MTFEDTLNLIAVKGINDSLFEGYVNAASFEDVDPGIARDIDGLLVLYERVRLYIEEQLDAYGIDWG